MSPRSLVTGACGFIGTHVVEELVQAGHEVLATDLPSAWEKDDQKAGRFPSVIKNLGVLFKPADIREPRQLEGLVEGLDHVFHVASVFNYSASWSSYYGVNVGGTRNLLSLVQQRSPELKRFVLWGAGGVYGLHPYDEGPVREDWPPAPQNDYLRSKWFQEHLALQFCRQHGISLAILRPTTVYGPRQAYGFGQLLLQTARSNPVTVPASLDNLVPMVHVRDVSGAGLHLAGASDGEGIFNVNDDTIIDTVSLMRLVAELTGHRFVALPGIPLGVIKGAAHGAASVGELINRVVPGFKPPVERPTIDFLGTSLRYDTSKLKATGYRFRYPQAKEGLQQTLEWYRKEGWL